MQKNIDDNDTQKKSIVKTESWLARVSFMALAFDVIAWTKNKEDFVERAPILVSFALGFVIFLIINAKIIKQESLQWTRNILISAILLKFFSVYSWVSGISSIDVLLHSWYFWISQVLWLLYFLLLLSTHDELTRKKSESSV